MRATLHRSARMTIRATRAQRRRLYGLLRSTGDVRALVLECNRQLRRLRRRGDLWEPTDRAPSGGGCPRTA